MAAAREHLEFRRDERAEVLARMGEVARNPGGWINFHPAIDAEAEPPRESSLFGIFSASGPAVPICTWMPGKRPDRREPVSIGVQHGFGPRAVARLDELGIAVPAGWRVRQDHPRRGLVITVPPEEGYDRTLEWLLLAGAALSSVPLTGTWRATIFARS